MSSIRCNTHVTHTNTSHTSPTGPSHFTANTGRPLGVTLARRRCLAVRQWAVASVHHADWTAARGLTARAGYLRRLLGEAVTRVGKPWDVEL